ncbi:MAG: hypothetical protein K2M44_02985 [Clostridia bacterium]|nr:hypothetical protein [Clostridia bacterium]
MMNAIFAMGSVMPFRSLISAFSLPSLELGVFGLSVLSTALAAILLMMLIYTIIRLRNYREEDEELVAELADAAAGDPEIEDELPPEEEMGQDLLQDTAATLEPEQETEDVEEPVDQDDSQQPSPNYYVLPTDDEEEQSDEVQPVSEEEIPIEEDEVAPLADTVEEEPVVDEEQSDSSPYDWNAYAAAVAADLVDVEYHEPIDDIDTQYREPVDDNVVEYTVPEDVNDEEPVVEEPEPVVAEEEEEEIEEPIVLKRVPKPEKRESEPKERKPFIMPLPPMDGQEYELRFDRSFTAKLIQADDIAKAYYSELKNELYTYEKVHGRMSWSRETFRCHRDCVARLGVRGKTVCLYLPLNAADFEDTKYKVEDVSDVAANEEATCMYRIKNNRRLNYAKELIAMVMKPTGCVKGVQEHVDYSYLPYETDEQLMQRGLVKAHYVKKRNYNK